MDNSCKEMLGKLYYKGIAGLSSMQGMTRAFIDEKVTKNLYHFIGSGEKQYLPHGVTLNEFLERVDPAEMDEIQKDIVYKMIRGKTFVDAKALKKSFKRLPICIVTDGQYVSTKVIRTCKSNRWDYLI